MKTKVVFTSNNLPEASMISGFLDSHGIENEITHDILPQLAGDIPFSDAAIQIIVDAKDAEKAIALIKDPPQLNDSD